MRVLHGRLSNVFLGIYALGGIMFAMLALV